MDVQTTAELPAGVDISIVYSTNERKLVVRESLIPPDIVELLRLALAPC